MAKSEKTVLFTYLQNTQTQISPGLLVETDRKQAATGKAANVSGKVYPRVLRRWVDFPQLHRQQFDALTTVFNNECLFPSFYESSSIARDLSPGKRRDEQDIRPFIRAYIEVSSTRIVNAFLRRTTDPKYAGLNFRFSNNAHGTILRKAELGDTGNACSDSSGHGSMPSRKRKLDSSSSLAPDRWGQCIREGQSNNNDEVSESILPGEYKAAHKVRGSDSRSILGNSDMPPAESLIDDYARRSGSVDSGGSGADSQQQAPDVDSSQASKKFRQNEMTIAEVLCQAYHYMIVYGCMYSYVTSGEGTVFLMVVPESVETLLYHYVDHASVASPITQPGRDLVCVPAAQMVTLVIKALDAGWQPTATMLRNLPRWPEPASRAQRLIQQQGGPPAREDNNDNNNNDNDTGGRRGRHGGMPPPPPPSSGGHGDGATQPRSDSTGGASRPFDRFERPRYKYCTQACLLGLCRGGPFDRACPNTPEHANYDRLKIGADGVPCHAISAAELCAMMLDQLTFSINAGLECLMKYGMFGTIGTLFKVTLCAYGYTFVAKGVQDADQKRLREEAALYADPATQHLQGVLMPVYLGCIELEEYPFFLPSGALIWHMMFMSWAGVSLARRVPDCISDVGDAVDTMQCELYRHGIYHRDMREANLTWNAELGRLMAIDFDRAFIMDEEDYAESPRPSASGAGPEAEKPLETKTEANKPTSCEPTAATLDAPKLDKRKREEVDEDGVERKRTHDAPPSDREHMK